MRHPTLKCAAILLFWLAAIGQASGAQESASAQASRTAIATFAGGCFWCMEPPFDKLEGVLSTVSGYMGGHQKNPTYKSVSSGRSGHAEVVQITYDPELVSYAELLEVFWVNIDPFAKDRQFCDSGSQYRSGIFYHDAEQQKLAIASRDEIAKRYGFTDPIVTEIERAETFYPAEEYHQNYYTKNPVRYKYYRFGCGRDRRLKEIWDTS